MSIQQLRAELAALDKQICTAQAAWVDEDGAERAPTEVECSDVNALLDSRDGVLNRIETTQRMEAARAAAATPLVAAPAATPAAAMSDSGDARQKLGKFGFAVASKRGDPNFNVTEALARMGEGRLAQQINDLAPRAELSSAGANEVIPDPLMAEIVPLLFADSAFMAAGPVELPLPNGAMTIPRGASKPTASWGSEGAHIASSTMTFDQIALSAKILRIMVPMQNSLLAYAVPSTYAYISNAILQTLSEQLDVAGLRADGAGDTPKGLLSLINAGNQFDATTPGAGETAVETAVRIEGDLRAAVQKPVQENIPLRNPNWIMNPAVAAYLADLRDGNGNPFFPGMGAAKGARTLKGYPVRETTQIPLNLGGGAESEIHFADFSYVYYGIARGLGMAVSEEASYWDGTELQSAFDRDQTVIRGVTELDFTMSYDKAGAVINKVTWQ